MSSDLAIMASLMIPAWQAWVLIGIVFMVLLILAWQLIDIQDLHIELNEWRKLGDTLEEANATHHTPEGWDHVIPAGVPTE